MEFTEMRDMLMEGRFLLSWESIYHMISDGSIPSRAIK